MSGGASCSPKGPPEECQPGVSVRPPKAYVQLRSPRELHFASLTIAVALRPCPSPSPSLPPGRSSQHSKRHVWVSDDMSAVLWGKSRAKWSDQRKISDIQSIGVSEMHQRRQQLMLA